MRSVRYEGQEQWADSKEQNKGAIEMPQTVRDDDSDRTTLQSA